MKDLPFDASGLCQEDLDRLHDIYKSVKAKFDIEFTGHIDFHLEEFEVFRNYRQIELRNSYAISHQDNDSYFFFIDAHPRPLGKGKFSGKCDYQTWALAYLKCDFGRILIRRETLTDKLIELVHPVELDFEEDKAFSDTFYVLVNDRKKAISAINRNFRNAVMDVRDNDFVIEIVEHTLVVGSHDPMSPEKALHLIEFVTRLSTMC